MREVLAYIHLLQVQLDRLSQKYNPNHGAHGHFSDSDSAVAIVHQDGTREPGPKHPSDQNATSFELPTASKTFQSENEEINKSSIETLAKKNNMTPDEYKTAVTNHLQDLMKDAKPFIRVQEASLQKILDSGRFKSQFETGTSGGGMKPALRAKIEEGLFRFPEDGDHKDRPIYGYSETNEDGHSNKTAISYDPMEGYGNVRVALNDDVTDRTTTTFGDSLVNALDNKEFVPKGGSLSEPMKQPTYKSVHFASAFGSDPLKYKTLYDYVDETGMDYAENQYHGGLSTKDIKHVYFPSEPSSVTKSMLKAKNIPYSVEGSK